MGTFSIAIKLPSGKEIELASVPTATIVKDLIK
jgi:hypothetical protein